MGELTGERDRLQWLRACGVSCPEVIDWIATDEGACVVMTAIRGVPATELRGAELLAAWPSMAAQLAALHALPVERCPFERGLSWSLARASAIAARDGVRREFLAEEDLSKPADELFARLAVERTLRLQQERRDRVVCHGDACLPNFMVDPGTHRCTGLIDVGRLGAADRYVDLASVIANAREQWLTRSDEAHAFDILFDTLGVSPPDHERIAYYSRLDPLTWD